MGGHLWFLSGALDSHPLILHRMTQRRSSPKGLPSRCLDAPISVCRTAAGCGGQDIKFKGPYDINFRSAPPPLVWHPCCRPPVVVVAITRTGSLKRSLALTSGVCSAPSGGPRRSTQLITAVPGSCPPPPPQWCSVVKKSPGCPLHGLVAVCSLPRRQTIPRVPFGMPEEVIPTWRAWHSRSGLAGLAGPTGPGRAALSWGSEGPGGGERGGGDDTRVGSLSTAGGANWPIATRAALPFPFLE